MITFHIKFWRKIKKTIIEYLQPGASRFYCYNGKLLVVSPGRNYYCNICLSKATYIETHDAYKCTNCNLWLEESCKDQDCNYCNKDK